MQRSPNKPLLAGLLLQAADAGTSVVGCLVVLVQFQVQSHLQALLDFCELPSIALAFGGIHVQV